MGNQAQVLVQEVGASCPNCLGAGSLAQQRRVDQLSVEVDEARQENQRLNKHSHKLRAALEAGRHRQHTPHGRGYEPPTPAANSTPSRRIEEELLQLRRTHLELKRENALLKQGGFGPAKGQRHERRVSLQHFHQLRRQLEELQRAHDAAASHTERLRSQSRSGSPTNVLSPSGAYGTGGQRPLGLGSASGLGGSVATSGLATPVNGEFSSPFDSSFNRGCDSSFNGKEEQQSPNPAEADLRRRMQAVQAENERLRRQVRMLASKSA